MLVSKVHLGFIYMFEYGSTYITGITWTSWYGILQLLLKLNIKVNVDWLIIALVIAIAYKFFVEKWPNQSDKWGVWMFNKYFSQIIFLSCHRKDRSWLSQKILNYSQILSNRYFLKRLTPNRSYKRQL